MPVDKFDAVGDELTLGRPALVFDRGALHVVDETMNDLLEPIVTVVGYDRDVRTADMAVRGVEIELLGAVCRSVVIEQGVLERYRICREEDEAHL